MGAPGEVAAAPPVGSHRPDPPVRPPQLPVGGDGADGGVRHDAEPPLAWQRVADRPGEVSGDAGGRGGALARDDARLRHQTGDDQRLPRAHEGVAGAAEKLVPDEDPDEDKLPAERARPRRVGRQREAAPPSRLPRRLRNLGRVEAAPQRVRGVARDRERLPFLLQRGEVVQPLLEWPREEDASERVGAARAALGRRVGRAGSRSSRRAGGGDGGALVPE